MIKIRPINSTINYHELLMKYNDTSKYDKYKLPSGFHYEFYKPGDEYEWFNIQQSSGSLISFEKDFHYFYDFYGSFLDELNKRCVFIVDDKTNKKIATATVSLLENEEYGSNATVDWVAISKDYQGMHLSKPLISKVLEISNSLSHKSIILHSQTTTWLAAKIYLDFGFEPLNINDVIGWKILKRLTSHEKLKDYDEATDEEMYDKRNIEIEKILDNIYGKDNYYFSVWYKNGLHNVYVYCNGNSFEYEYFIEDDKIRLEKINSNKRS